MKTKEHLINGLQSLVVAVIGVLLTNHFTIQRESENSRQNETKQSQRDVAADVKAIGTRLENASQRISSLEGQVSVLRQMLFKSRNDEATAFITPDQVEWANALFPNSRYVVDINTREPAAVHIGHQVPPGFVRIKVSQKFEQ